MRVFATVAIGFLLPLLSITCFTGCTNNKVASAVAAAQRLEYQAGRQFVRCVCVHE